MRTKTIVYLLLCASLLTGCATAYQKDDSFALSGGYQDIDMGKDVVRVKFAANGYTSLETAQAYWLWRCQEIALSRGFDGFEVMSDMHFVDASRPRGDLLEEGSPYLHTAHYVPVPIFVPSGRQNNFPYLMGDIHLLKGPLEGTPPKFFDARKLKEALAPYVEPSIKGRSNVKPHIHEYLMPPGKLDAHNDSSPARES